MDPDITKGICISFCVLSTIAALVCVILGFSTLEATEYGLDYSWISKSVDPTAKTNGLYFLGVFHSFYKFPKNVQTIEFSRQGVDYTETFNILRTRTSDGLEVSLEISFQYSIQPENIYKLFTKYGMNYRNIFVSIATHELTEAATKYSAYDYFSKRGEIKNYFFNSLNEAFKRECYSGIEFLQLRNVDLPNLFERAIQDTEVIKQSINKAKAELNKVKVEIDTMIKTSHYQRNVTLNQAGGNAQAIIENAKAYGDSIKATQGSKAKAYKILKDKLVLNNNDLLDYIKTQLIGSHSSQNLAISLRDINQLK